MIAIDSSAVASVSTCVSWPRRRPATARRRGRCCPCPPRSSPRSAGPARGVEQRRVDGRRQQGEDPVRPGRPVQQLERRGELGLDLGRHGSGHEDVGRGASTARDVTSRGSRAAVRVALFITCLGDTLFPQSARPPFACSSGLGHEVVFPADQTCCGQMHLNSGYAADGRGLPLGAARSARPPGARRQPGARCTRDPADHGRQ